jgi:Family of unknown function (DUF5317)
MLLLYAVLFGVLVGFATHGSLQGLADVRVRLWPVALLGLAFQAALFSSPLAEVVGPWGPPLYVLSTGLVLGALVANIRQPGFWLIALGAVLNFAVIAANGGQMPASPAAVALLTGQPVVPADVFSNSALAGPHTILPLLGDVYVLPRPIPFANVFSIGDVLIGLGGALWLVRVMQRGGVTPPQAGEGTRVTGQPAPAGLRGANG